MDFIKYPLRVIGSVTEQSVEDSQYEAYSVVDAEGRVIHYPAKRPETQKAIVEEKLLSERIMSGLIPLEPMEPVNSGDNFCVQPTLPDQAVQSNGDAFSEEAKKAYPLEVLRAIELVKPHFSLVPKKKEGRGRYKKWLIELIS